MAGELLNEIVSQEMINPMASFESFVNAGQSGAAWAGEGAKSLLLFGGGAAALALKGKISHGGSSHAKPAEIREARVRFVKPWESGLLLSNSSFYESQPVLDEAGNHVIDDDGAKQYTREYHQVITPGLHGLLNTVALHRKMVLVNNIRDEVSFPMSHIMDKDKVLYNLTGGMSWSHVRALDQDYQPMVYEYRRPSFDGKRPAGPISAAEALHNAILTAPTRAEAARQLVIIIHPEIVARLHKETDPLQTAKDPAFLAEIEDVVHDRFLERGSVLIQVGVTPNLNPDAVAANAIAAQMKKRNKILSKNSKRSTTTIQLEQEQLEDDELPAATSGTLLRMNRSNLPE